MHLLHRVLTTSLRRGRTKLGLRSIQIQHFNPHRLTKAYINTHNPHCVAIEYNLATRKESTKEHKVTNAVRRCKRTKTIQKLMKGTKIKKVYKIKNKIVVGLNICDNERQLGYYTHKPQRCKERALQPNLR